jgi:hypothetical protein
VNWDQIRTILWLRWRLSRNQLRRAGALGAVLSALMLVSAVMLGVAGFVGGLLAGALAFKDAQPMVLLFTWDGLTLAFLLFWMVGLMAELQRSESIDLQRLMHLPVSLRPVFFFNYLASHLAVSVVLFVPAMTGLALGLSFGRGPMMLLLLPLALSMVFMVTAWTYCLRGWLAALMTNPRKRRAVIMIVTLVFIVAAQAPNFYFQIIRRDLHQKPPPGATSAERKQFRQSRQERNQRTLEVFISAQKYVPPLWLPVGAQALAGGNVLPALLGFVGCAGLGALGLRRAYRSTIQFYYGNSGGKPAASPSTAAPATSVPRPRSSPARARPLLVERGLPFVPEEAAAVGLATLRSCLRAPEVKMAWGSTFIIMLFAGMMVLVNTPREFPEQVRPLAATAAVAVTMFTLLQFMGNHFGFDRAGFRALVLSPVERRWILLGKNLANLPPAFCAGMTFLAVAAWRVRLGPDLILAGVLQWAAMFLLMSALGNMLSILVPYRIQAGSMKPTKMPAKATLLIFAGHALFPVFMIPAIVPAVAEMIWQFTGGAKWIPVSLILSALLAAVAVFAYWRSLAPLGRFLQRREMAVLAQVSTEVE